MTKPVTEPTPARESANYGWRIRQLERRPRPRSVSICAAFFACNYDFSTGYPAGDWGAQDLQTFYTNDDTVFADSGADSISILTTGFFIANMKVGMGIDGQFLDLPPQAGTTRLKPGCLASKLRLYTADGFDLTHDFYFSKDDYELTSQLAFLGEFEQEVSGFTTVYSAPTLCVPIPTSADALIGPNNTGTFPELPPSCTAWVFLARVADNDWGN